MTTELYWLSLTMLMTALFWVPYILNRIKVMGMIPALSEMGVEGNKHDVWGARCMAAHKNAVENLAIFAPAVLVLHVLGGGTAITASAVMIYFFARLAHYFVYTFGIPFLRTISFAIGWLATIAIILTVLGWI
ncbi:MAG: MAPEG family protein [Rhizobiales bacterium]|nr:MAPEG family protein [Hyphomicrobiales bacterium]